jgi:outer membrane receptor protein involved in Fe transport
MIDRRLCASSAALIAGLASVMSPALAQEAAPVATASRAETVVVTARLRSESLQEVPLSIAAFGEVAIERQRIDSLDRLSALAPSLSASDPFGRNNPSVSMRASVTSCPSGSLSTGSISPVGPARTCC